jgi:hypothetical protein
MGTRVTGKYLEEPIMAKHYIFPQKPDWHIIKIWHGFVVESDCNYGRHRKVYSSGKIEHID